MNSYTSIQQISLAIRNNKQLLIKIYPLIHGECSHSPVLHFSQFQARRRLQSGLKIKKIIQKQKIHQNLEVLLFDVEAELPFLPKGTEELVCIHSIGQKAVIQLLGLALSTLQKVIQQTVTVTIVQIHQHFPEIAQLKPNFLLISESSFKDSQELNNTNKLLLKETVFQKLCRDQLQDLFLTSPLANELSIEQDYIIIMLSGDAPDQQNMRIFTKESADLLINRLIYLLGYLKEKQYKIIIQNGPRTGKHNLQTKKQQCLHTFKENEDPSLAIDPITHYFTARLQQLKIPFHLYNFAFQVVCGTRKVHSFYKHLLYVAQQRENLFLFQMESVSMCSELPFYLQKQKLFVYHTSSTNQSHEKVASNGFELGLFNKFSEGEFKIIWCKKQRSGTFDEVEQLLAQILRNLKLKIY